MLAPASTCLGMFAKFWEPGQVKTRLAAAIGNERAAGIHRAFVETLISRFAAVANHRELCIAPPERLAEFRRATPDTWNVAVQAEGDLGRRMQSFFCQALKQVERVVLIGTDSPDLPAEYVAAALDALHSSDVVLGPAADGGYYLVGAARRVPPIFDGIAWSTPAVWPQTIELLKSSAIAWHELPGWYDVDDQQSLSALLLSLSLERQGDPHLSVLLDRLQALLSDRPAG